MGQELRFDDIERLLERTERAGTAAEIHGVLAGMLCLDEHTVADQWMAQYFGEEEPPLEQSESSDFVALFEETRRQLGDEDFRFSLLLPDDEDSLARRARALSEWCHGFLQGVGYRGEGSEWPAPCGEILDDFLEIVRLDIEDPDESDEVAFTELSEYVRMAVKIIQAEIIDLTPLQRH